MMRRLIIISAGLCVVACSPSKPPLNKANIEGQIAKCGLEFRDPVWEMRGNRRPALKLTVPHLDDVTEQTVDCVTKVAKTHDVSPELNAGDAK